MSMSEHVKDNKLSASLEDYLEAVLAVIIEKKAVRAKDIADRLNVSRSSVTGALQALAAKGYIHYAPYDVITLTSEGEKVAGKIFDKHKTLTDFFAKMLLIDPVLAEKTACEMEHVMPEEVIERLNKLVSYVRDSLKDPSEWADRFSKYCKDHKKA
ncbi:MAG: metal-dependent transcriptional regulator [Verrucomicrobia bacterium]|nr:metal-dependent transcriptional regulator [Verrucomicrobiota bacterium]MBO7107561.1 metal-dependent transcriptional regulator [Verrucomicrobiota bacterium]MBO7524491.1 metal-dependent transcriptional regulator [Verrucomicrobiota bacterium]MBP5761138.1 metal-dependent transcriptional regulator [Verrucomicrobiota bacterium]